MLKIIDNVIKTRQLCEINSDFDDTSTFGVGHILARDDKFYIACYINEYGEYNGMSCKLIKNLYAIQTDTQYLCDMQRLMKFKNVVLGDSLDFSDNLLINFLKQIQSEKRICSIELCESDCDDVIGFVDEIDEESKTVTLTIIDTHGKQNGKSVVDIETITEVYYKTRWLTLFEILHK